MPAPRLIAVAVVVVVALSGLLSVSGQDSGTPSASPAATPVDIVVVALDGRYEISGNGVVGLSDPFVLDDGNWFFTVDATGTGDLTSVELVQVEGPGNEFLTGIAPEPLPYRDEGVMRIYENLDRAGDYVLFIDATDPASIDWRVVIARTPPKDD